MASSQDLVPTGGAYGSRQETVALMNQAGVPLNSSPTPAASPAQAGRSAPRQPVPPNAGTGGGFNPLDLLGQNGPEAFPFIGAEPAVPPMAEPDSPLAALAASSQSTFGLAVLARLSQTGR